MAKLLRLYVFLFSVFKGDYPFKRWCANIWHLIQISFANNNSLVPFKISALKYIGFGRVFLWLLLTANCLLASAQSFPVQLIPQVTPPPPIYFSQYADASTTNSPLRLQIILKDLEISNREIRLKAYFQGNGISFQSNDVVVGSSPLFLEGGVPLVLTNAELAPYFRFENITGISPNVYGQVIPEGAYQFCYEVYDVLTGNRLSQKSCAVSVVFQNEPPFLISPRNKTLVAEYNPQNIIFQWTPRSINVSNVEYEISMVEIWDTQIDPQAAFLSSPPVFQTTTNATTYVYGPSDPLLLSGKNYAWRIQAKAKQGAEEIGLFKNQGYSEIFSFSYAGSCDLPIGIGHEVKGSTNANIFWDDFSTAVPEYTIRYRQKSPQGGGNEWFLNKTTTNQTTLWDLKAGTTYEYQLQKKCVVTGSEWSMAKQFTTFLADNEASVYQCGITPNFSLTNKEPLPKISAGETFVAGDFPINVLEVSGSNGRFTGKGYVTIPYLNSIRVGVKFTNVLINTDKQMSEGTVVTVYDPNLGSILGVDEVVDQFVETYDAIADWLFGYTGTEVQQKELDEKTNELNQQIDKAIADPNLDAEKKEELVNRKNDLNNAKNHLLEEGPNPTSESKEAYQNSSQEVITELNSLESISEVTTENDQTVTNNDIFDGIINFSTPEPQLISELINGRNYNEDITGIGTLTGEETSAYRVFDIKANKTLYVSNNKVSSSDINDIQENLESVGNDEYRLWIHYDFDAKQVKYKIAFGSNYFNGVSIEKNKLAELYNDVLTSDLKGYIGSAILNVTEKFDGLLDAYKHQLPLLDASLIADFMVYDILKIAINFTRNCATGYQSQEIGIVPRCLWDQNINVSMAYYAGFIDAAWEIGEMAVSFVQLKEAWDPFSPFFTTTEAFEIRKKTVEAIRALQKLYDNKNGEIDAAIESAKGELYKYVDETLNIDPQARYNQGKIIFEVASLFFGVGEAKAFLKTGVLTSQFAGGLTTLASKYSVGLLIKKLPGKLKRLPNNVLAYIISIDNYIQIARYSDDGLLIVDKWLEEPIEIIEQLGEVAYKSDASGPTSLIDDIAIGRSESGEYGITKALSLIRQLVTRPTYLSSRLIWSKPNKTTTLIGKWLDELEIAIDELKKIGGTDLNIYMRSGKFDNKGGFNVLSIGDEDWIKLVDEIEALGIKPKTKAFDDYVWNNYNQPWLESALQRGDVIVVWSDPKLKGNLEKLFAGDDTFGETFYSRELKFIKENAVKYNYDYIKGITTGTFSR